jgi:hypothetical protein
MRKISEGAVSTGFTKQVIDIREILAETDVDQAYLQTWVTKLGL